MSKLCFVAISYLATSILGYDPSDGFDNNWCLRLLDFSIDGDWWATSADEIDWSSVLEGQRTSEGTSSEMAGNQNQCTKNHETAYRQGYYYTAGIFCDLFDTIEHSMIKTANKHDSNCCPEKWIPLQSKSMQDKGDLTNVYYVGSSLDLIICAAFERIDIHGASYMDLEFNKNIISNPDADTDSTKPDCHEAGVVYDGVTYDQNTMWRCRYVDRVSTDIQISFKIANAITDSEIIVSVWDTVNTEFKILRTEALNHGQDGDSLYYYRSPDKAFEAAVNNGSIKASSFGYICDDKVRQANTSTYDGAGCPFIEGTGAFFEACIDFKALGFRSLDFSSVLVKSRASINGAYKDTSGPLDNTIRGPDNYFVDIGTDTIERKHAWNDPRTDGECNVSLTPFPTLNPTTVTLVPTTNQPTGATNPPTTIQPTSQPSLTPTEATGVPTSIPTDATSTPTSPTKSPTQNTPEPSEISAAPTEDTPVPTPGPTVVAGSPSNAPTEKPSDSPNPPPTVKAGSPSKAPSPHPTSGAPTPSPTDVPTPLQGCSADQNPLRDDCLDPALSGCSLLFTVKVDVCLFNKKLERDDVYDILKLSDINIIEQTPSWIGICTLENAVIESYTVSFGNYAAVNDAETTNCDACNGEPYPYTIDAEIAFFCNNCPMLQAVLETYRDEKGSWDRTLENKWLELSIPRDSLCGTGFAGVSQQSISAIYRGTDGTQEGECVCGPSTSVTEDNNGDGDGGNEDMAITHKPFVYVALCAVFAFLL